jgi:hypothetical protein
VRTGNEKLIVGFQFLWVITTVFILFGTQNGLAKQVDCTSNMKYYTLYIHDVINYH